MPIASRNRFQICSTQSAVESGNGIWQLVDWTGDLAQKYQSGALRGPQHLSNCDSRSLDQRKRPAPASSAQSWSPPGDAGMVCSGIVGQRTTQSGHGIVVSRKAQ